MAKYNRYSLPNQQSIFAFFCLFFSLASSEFIGTVQLNRIGLLSQERDTCLIESCPTTPLLFKLYAGLRDLTLHDSQIRVTKLDLVKRV